MRHHGSHPGGDIWPCVTQSAKRCLRRRRASKEAKEQHRNLLIAEVNYFRSTFCMFDVLHANRLHTFASHCRCSEAHNIVHVMAIRSLEKAKLIVRPRASSWPCGPVALRNRPSAVPGTRHGVSQPGPPGVKCTRIRIQKCDFQHDFSEGEVGWRKGRACT
jgi:hypothetical protein